MTTERSMSAKGFLHKCKSKAANAAAGFLAAHREWLTTGELSSVTSPILAKFDSGELLPTPSLDAIKQAVFGHMLASDAAKAERQIEEGQNPTSNKNFICTILNEKEEVQTRFNEAKGEDEDLIKGFETPQEAERWADRRLFEGGSDWFAQVESTKIHLTSGQPFTFYVEREESFARILKKPKPAVSKTRGVSTSKLGFGVKVSNDRSSFSRG